MSGFSTMSLKGIQKAGDVLIPGSEDLPKFSDVKLMQDLHRMTDYMNADDREGLKLLMAIFAITPAFLIHLILQVVSKHESFPDFIGAVFRQINMGVRGVVFTLYYSDLDDHSIFQSINYNTTINSPVTQDTEMDTLLMNSNPLASSLSQDPKEVFLAAKKAQKEIAKLSLEERMAMIEKVRHVILRRQEEIVEVIQKQTQKARIDILTSELFPLFENLDFIAHHAKAGLSPEKVATPIAMMGKASKIWFEPMGTILVISPWNYPFYQAITPITLSFVTGNATVYKPSELTPLTGLVESILSEAGFKPHWAQVVYGDGKVGSELINQRPQKVFFTGSVATGKKIMAQASQYLIPVELELGGKDPMIVFEDVNMDRAVKGAVWGAFTNSGQSCTSVERLYVQESIYETFKKRIVEEAKTIKLGVDKDGDADMGAMISDKQVQIIADLVQDAVKNGATMLTGQSWDFKSKFIPAIVLEGTTHNMRINKEEIFGPILPIMKFKNEEEAIELANDSDFGLSASIWSKDKARCERVASQIVTGNISINNVMVSEGNHSLPFGGVKDSGIGRYKGVHGLRGFTNMKSVMVDADSSKIEANWYPYTPTKNGLFGGLIQSLFGGGIKKWVGLVRYGLPLETHAKKAKRS
jgi:acyl-CoA reductase-like NAD-dependent aldehyde dehydrogenase